MLNLKHRNALIDQAKKCLKNPYPSNSAFAYSASVLTKKGNIYASAQYGSDTHSLTLHAEQAALAHAAAHGEGEILALLCTSNEKLDKGEFTNPCHMCKQLLWENQRNSKISITIILLNSFGETKDISLNDLISYPWPK